MHLAARPVGRDLAHDVGRQRQAGAAAEHRDEARRQREDLGDNPGADREISAAQSKHRDRNRYRQKSRKRTGDQQRHVDVHIQRAGQIEQRIAAETDIGLLADRDETGIPGEQIPQLGEREIVGHLGDEPHLAGVAPPWHGDQHRERDDGDDGKDATGPRSAIDPNGLHVSLSCAGTARSVERSR